MIEEIKDNVSIIDTFNKYQIKIEYSNKCKCPFHYEKTASLKIYEKTNTWYCFRL